MGVATDYPTAEISDQSKIDVFINDGHYTRISDNRQPESPLLEQVGIGIPDDASDQNDPDATADDGYQIDPHSVGGRHSPPGGKPVDGNVIAMREQSSSDIDRLLLHSDQLKYSEDTVQQPDDTRENEKQQANDYVISYNSGNELGEKEANNRLWRNVPCGLKVCGGHIPRCLGQRPLTFSFTGLLTDTERSEGEQR